MVRTSIESNMSRQFDLGQEQILGSTNTAGTRQGQGQAQYRVGQVEPTRDTLEPDPNKSIMLAYVQVINAIKNVQKARPEAGTAMRKDLVGPA